MGILFPAAAVRAESDLDEKADRILDQGVLGLVGAQEHFLSLLDPGRTCSSAHPDATEPEPTEVGVYTCDFEEPETSPSPGPESVATPEPSVSPVPVPTTLPTRAELQSLFGRVPGSLILGLSTGNDNYPGRLQQRGPTDLAYDAGHTFDLSFSAIKVFGRDTKLGKRGDAIGFEMGTELYSHPTQVRWDTYGGMIQAQVNSRQAGIPVMMTGADGVARPVFINNVSVADPMKKGQFRQQSLDRQYLDIFKEWNREKFTIVGKVEFSKHITSGKSFGNSLQNFWHRTGGANYTYRDENGLGAPATWTAQTVGRQATMKANGTPGPMMDVVDVSVGPDIPKDPAILEYGSWAGGLGGEIRRTTRMFRGTCELQASLSAHLGVQGDGSKISFDRNSRVQVGGDLGASLLKNKKWNDSKVSLKGGAAVIYFPRTTSVGNFGWNANAEVQGNFHTGSSGNRIQTAIQYRVRGLAGTFQDVDDYDPIARLTVRYIFGGKRKN